MGNASIKRVANEPAKDDVAILRGGKIRYCVASVDTVLHKTFVAVCREESFLENGEPAVRQDRDSLDLWAWRDLVSFGACAVESGDSSP